MSGISKQGFTLIELMVVIILIGLITAITIPNLDIFRPSYQRKEFIENLNSLTQVAWYTALATHQPQKVVFDFKAKMISLEQQASSPTNSLPGTIQKRELRLPDNLEFQQFFIDGKNDLGQTGRITTKVWFYVLGNGMSQEVILNILDTANPSHPVKFSLVLNPFMARYKEYDTFQNP